MSTAIFHYAELSPLAFTARMIQQDSLQAREVIAALVGDMTVIANVRMGGDCPANVCTKQDKNVLLKNNLFEGPFDRTGILIGSPGSFEPGAAITVRGKGGAIRAVKDTGAATISGKE